MMGQSIRARMAYATLLPVALVVLLTAGAFWRWRVQDLEDTHQQRIHLLTHQFSIYCANGLFAGNVVSLQNVISEIQREPDLLAVYVFDENGKVLASSGRSVAISDTVVSSAAYADSRRDAGIDVVTEPIQTVVLPLDDLFSPERTTSPVQLGRTVLEFSRDGVNGQKLQSFYVALAIGLLGMGLGGWLAFQLGNGVVLPIIRLYQMINRIGRGDFTVNENMAPNDPLRDLQGSLNVMARRLAWGRDEMEARVAAVTQELRQKMELAEGATRAKSKFLASASHDLRQPAHALGMFVARQRQLPMDPQMRHLVDQMDVSVQSMQDLLDSLLDLSRLDSGAVSVRMSMVNLDEVLQSVHKLVGTLASTKGLRLRVRPTRLWGRSDLFLLQRMLTNLAMNAVRYTQTGTVLIACRLCSQGQQVRIEVSDSGIGIPAEHHEDIFQEFYQLQNSAGERGFGMGLGLNIVQRSASLLGHRVEVRSSPGCGSRFSIVLDAAVAQPASTPSANEFTVQGLVDFMGARVLVIEDNVNALHAVGGLLESWGCRVFAAESQGQALNLVVEMGAPDVILSDYQLGSDGSGIAAIAAVRNQVGVKIPACLISGETDVVLQNLAQEAGLPLMHKPVRPAKLRTLLRRLLAE